MAAIVLPTLATLLGWFDVKAKYGAKGDNTTDDTAAIQAAINAADAAGGGVVYFPQGRYYVKSAITLPNHDGSTGQPPIAITLKGASPPQMAVWGDTRLGMPPNAGQSSIRSDLVGGSIFSVPQNAGGILEAYFSAVTVHVEDLAIETYANPNVTCLDLQHALCATVRRVICVPGNYYNNSQPTNTGSTGIIMPHNDNGAMSTIEDVVINGYYTGLQAGEHTTGKGIVFLSACNDAVVLPGMNHSCTFACITSTVCKNGLTFTGNIAGRNNTRIRVHDFRIEHPTSGWSAGGFDINDPSNYGRGQIFYAINANTGYESTISQSGGTGLTVTNIGT